MTHLLCNLRWYCLGFGFFWSMPLSMMCGVPAIAAPSGHWLWFVWVQQFAVVAFLPLCARIPAQRLACATSGLPFAAGLLLSLTGFSYVYCFTLGHSSLPLSVASGVLLGLSCALLFVLWQIVYANEGQSRASIYLPFASLVAVGICLAMFVLPAALVALCLICVLPMATAYTLWRSTRDMEPFATRPWGPYKRSVVADVWKPVLCASVVCFAWSLSSHLPALYEASHIVAMLIGLGCACCAVAFIGLKARASMGAFDVYQAIFPLIGIVLFVPALLGSQWTSFTVGILTFGARLMMLLTLMLCATYSARTQFSPGLIYLVCAFPLQVASFVGDTAGFLMVPGLFAQPASAFRIPAACFIVCFVGLVVASLGKRPRSLAEPADDTLLINPTPQEKSGTMPGPESTPAGDAAPGGPTGEGMTAEAAGNALLPPAFAADLSAREIEVVDLLLKGNTIAAISRKLFISENTTRGHMKRIYRKLNVHSRQELIDALEREAAKG